MFSLDRDPGRKRRSLLPADTAIYEPAKTPCKRRLESTRQFHFDSRNFILKGDDEHAFAARTRKDKRIIAAGPTSGTVGN